MTEAVYPGSLDPITLGHLDLIDRASRIFDDIHVAVVTNPSKNPLFSSDKRVELIKEVTSDRPMVTVGSFDGLLVDYIKQRQSQVILRGLRALSDFEYEFQMSMMNKRLAEDVETIYMMTGEDHSFVSSSLVKEVAEYGGDIDSLVPGPVKEALADKFEACN
ncbi:MAG: pantetheine-phosphate adenylyltransferase [bacterium]